MDEPTRDRAGDGGNGHAIQAALAGVVPEAEARGAGRKAFLSGLWLAAIGTLLSVGEPDDVASLLADRAAGIRGQGRNADVPLSRLDDLARDRRLREAGIVARVVCERLRPFAEDDARGDSFPEDFLDEALSLLAASWGPAHLRRTLADQIASIEDGNTAPVLPVEPSATNNPPRAAAPVPVTAPAPVTRAPHANLPAPEARRGARTADVHLDSETLSTGRGAYAVAMHLDAGDRRETREICGGAPDRTGREAALTGLAEALAALGPPVPGDKVRVSTPVEAVYRAAAPGAHGGQRLAHEAGLWAEVDRLAAPLDIEWCLRRSGTGTDLAQRCDRLLRERSAEAEREAMAAA